jgi:hypothetical protein
VTVTEDQSYRFDISPFMDDVDNSLSQLRMGLTSSYVTMDQFNLTFFYPRGIGSEDINVSLSDGLITVFKMLHVEVTSVNDVPEIMAMPGLTTNEDTKLTLDLTPFSMDEEDLPTQLKWRVEDAPSDLMNATIDDRNLMTIVPAPNLSGEGTIRLVVRDTGGNEARVNLTIKILPVNDAPSISGLQNIKVRVGVAYKLDVKPYVSDVDNEISELSVSVNTVYATVNSFVITFQYPNDENLENEMVRISVSDGKASGYKEIMVNLSFPPGITPPGEISIEAGKDTTLDLTKFVNDREDGQTGLKYAVSRVDKSLVDVSVDTAGNMKIRSVGDKTGSNDIVLTVTDTDGNKANQTMHVTVAPKKSVWGGSGTGDSAAMWGIPIALVGVIIGGAGGFYLVASRRKRKLELAQAAEEKEMIPTADAKLAAPAAVAYRPMGAVPSKPCFACGSPLVAAGNGSFQCSKCGRTQK